MTFEVAGSEVLVVGGTGFVGSNLVRELHRAGSRRIVVVDNLLSSERTEVLDLPRTEFLEGSIADDRVLDSLPDRLDCVFHLATFHGNQNSIAAPLADHENNTLTTLKLFDGLASRADVTRVVYSSAGCTVAEKIYGDARPTTEDDPVSLHLDSPYQISKVVGEMYANFYFARHGLPVVTARFQNVYGPGEILGAGRWRGTSATVWRNVTPTFIYRALKGLPLELENDGLSSRDFIYVGDIVKGLVACAVRGEPGEVYNLASGREVTIRELAETINGYVDPPARLVAAPRRTWDHSGNRFGSVRKAAEMLGFRAAVDLDTGIRETVSWTRQHLDQIDAAIEKHREHMPVNGLSQI